MEIQDNIRSATSFYERMRAYNILQYKFNNNFVVYFWQLEYFSYEIIKYPIQFVYFIVYNAGKW